MQGLIRTRLAPKEKERANTNFTQVERSDQVNKHNTVKMQSGLKSLIICRSVRSCSIRGIIISTRRWSSSPLHYQKGSNITMTDKEILQRIKIPPIKRVDESIDKMRARLIYQSRKRGILETDLLLSSFASKYLKSMTFEELKEYDELLNELDWDIYYWATKNYKISKVPDRWADSKLLNQLQDFAQNKDKQILKMPELDKY